MKSNLDINSFIKKVNWKPNDIPSLYNSTKENIPFLSAINNYFKAEALKKSLLLPNLRGNQHKSIAIYSDYGGEHKESNYYTYSILVCGYDDRIAFPVTMKDIRKKFKIGDREIAFKKFDSVSLRNAIPHYLKAADNLVIGLLFTLIVSKNVSTLFGKKESDTLELVKILQKNDLGKWRPKVAEKLLRITHLTAYLIGLLCEKDQKIFWMSDQDEIAPANSQNNVRMNLLQRILPIYTKNKFNCFGGAVPFQQRSVAHLDFLSLTDVVAGSIESYFTKSNAGGKKAFVKKGADEVLSWLAHDGVSLKKKTFLIDGHSENISMKYIDFFNEENDYKSFKLYI